VTDQRSTDRHEPDTFLPEVAPPATAEAAADCRLRKPHMAMVHCHVHVLPSFGASTIASASERPARTSAYARQSYGRFEANRRLHFAMILVPTQEFSERKPLGIEFEFTWTQEILTR
jgi:hypothetical protein